MKKENPRSPRKIPRKNKLTILFRPKSPCPFQAANIKHIDYKDITLIRRYVAEDWKIQPGRINNISACMQRKIKIAIKRARLIALLPYSPSHHQTHSEK